ncbi:MAG: exodeoxyribonuclease III [Candidatus Melainabacteria bacterium HGW-Melainabacteria-1]|nr:MAG: exodeoxyribonuclease III [Candidatus Melainabacteria bacterium HGW-Melainabacteria-1]
MKIYTWNVNGIRAVEKKGFLQWLEQTQPDLLCLQETKCWPAQLSYELLEGHGYHAYWHSAEKKGYSSVATFCRREPLAVHKGLGVDLYDREGRVLVTEFDDFVLYNVYFPNGQHDLGRVPFKLNFYRELLAQLNARVAAGQNVIVGGDWNTAHTALDIKNAKANERNTGFLPEERAMIDHYIQQGYVDVFRRLHPEVSDAYSWWSFRSGARERNIGWRLDYFMVNASFAPRIVASQIHADVMGSDHCPVSIELAEVTG